MTRGYSRGQIFLHWAVALLVVLQWQTSGPVAALLSAWPGNGSVERLVGEPRAALHILGGALLLLLVLLLLRSRATRGPIPTGEGPPVLGTLEWLTRLGLYLTLLALPLSGLAGGLWQGAFAGLHARLVTLLLVLIALHLGAVLWRTLARRERTLLRMLWPERRAVRQM
ncbi:MAG: cytochrome b/b6 domain-containing protein [Bauldia sp.]|nr:cytochrome b/b6 domain-containing protein [Bauldia sp.]